MIKKFFVPVLLTCLFAGVVALATPQEHDECSERKLIVEPEGSQGYRMSEDCKAAYVLPPEEGLMRISNFTFAPSKADCEGAVSGLNALTLETTTLNQLMKEKATLLQSTSRDKMACRGYQKRRDNAQGTLDGLKTKLLADQTNLGKLKTQKTHCAKNPDQVGCDDISDQIDDLNEGIQDSKEKISDASEALSSASEDLTSCETQHPHSNDLSDDTTQMQSLEQQITQLRPKVISEIHSLSKDAGAQGSMSFFSGHTALVKAFTDANRGRNNVVFIAMPLKNSHIFFQRIKKAANLNPIAEFTIFGASTQSPVDDATGGVQSGDAEDGDKLFGGAAGAQVALNLYASCRLRQAFGDLSNESARQAVANMIKPVVKYSYELQASKSIKINYNESYLYSLFKSHTDSGGFFWTSSSSSILENTVSNKWLTIVIESEDKDLQFDNAEQRLFELRKEVLDAALARVAKKSYVTTEDAQADGGTPPKDGAKTAAENLHKCANIYCQVAAVALDITDAIFGGSSSTGTTMKTVNLSDVENLVIKGNVEFMGGQTFKYGNSL